MGLIVDTKAMRVFLSVADTLNFSRSSELLHMSLSAVSRTIQRLEDDLGQTLLERDNRRVLLTHPGRQFREYAQKAVDDWQRLRLTLNAETALAGEVSLYCSVTASYSVLAPILEAFRVNHPAVAIMMHTGDQADGVARVISGQDDLAVIARPESLPPRLAFLPLRESNLVLCAPIADCAVRDMVINSDSCAADFDWSAIPFIVPERGASKDMLFEWFRDQGIRPNIYAQVAGHEAIVAMVGLGLGLGIAPQLVIETSGVGDTVAQVAARQPLPALKIGLCALKHRLENPLVESLWNTAHALG
jgi:LysR family positive regulator for ilvC